ncbi:MAG: flagellar export protein FliJ [Burkholderiaceae bacterium]|nr:flagellar export protein FliJ [Burkholderiaceae bacterium]
MSNLNALSVAVEAASRKRDQARKMLQAVLAAQKAAQAQLQQLEDYANEIQSRWGMRADATVKPEVMYHHYQFMDRLGHAAGIQSGVVSAQGGRVEAARIALLQAELRLTSLKKVIDKRCHDLELHQMRRDQKQTDERAALQYRSASQDPQGQEY